MAEPTTPPASAAAENGAPAEPQAPAPEQHAELEAPRADVALIAGEPVPDAPRPEEPQPAATSEAPEAPAEAPAEAPTEEPKKEKKKGRKAKDEPPAEQPAAVAVSAEPGAGGEAAPAAESNKKWYVVKVQSGREESIKEAIERRVKIEGLEEFFGQIIIPVERVTELGKNNKRVIKEKKLYPGYLMVEVEYNDRMLYLFRETSGVGDFVGGGLNHPPQPMKQKEVERITQTIPSGREVAPTKIKFEIGDRVRVRDGTFAGMDGEIRDVLEAKGVVRVELTIFGRPVPVELEPWQVEAQT
jgi:transcriptional antiterminator NusG